MWLTAIPSCINLSLKHFLLLLHHHHLSTHSFKAMCQQIILGSIAGFIGLISLGYSVIFLLTRSPRPPFTSELSYITFDTKTGEPTKPRPLPTLSDAPTVDITVVIPCYNEVKRLEPMLKESVQFLQTSEYTWEILIVDDGSKDGTPLFALDLAKKLGVMEDQIRIVILEKNRGKGGAVTHGMHFISGQYAIFADADGASKFSDLQNLVDSIKKHEKPQSNEKPTVIPAIAIGSRAHMVTTEAVVKRAFIRNFLMYGLHTLVYIFGIRTIGDTQCGFKLFNRPSISAIFPYMHTEGWIFDVEILILAIRKHIFIDEVSISWHEVPGSKLEIATASLQMAIDLVVTRLAYMLWIYNDSKKTRISKAKVN